jgi:hypothetical protein
MDQLSSALSETPCAEDRTGSARGLCAEETELVLRAFSHYREALGFAADGLVDIVKLNPGSVEAFRATAALDAMIAQARRAGTVLDPGG